MSSNTISINIRAVDEASNVIAGASQKMADSLKGVEGAQDGLTQAVRESVPVLDASGQAQNASAVAAEKGSAASKQATISYKDLTVGVAGVATASFALYNAWDSIGDAAVSVSRANLAVKSSADAVEGSQKKYNDTVAKFGSISPEAIAAEKDLQIAQERHSVAVERADMVQGNYSETIVKSALSVIPTMITMVSSLSAVKSILTGVTGADAVAEGASAMAKTAGVGPTVALTGASWGLNASLLANPITWIVIAIAAFVAAIILAYQNCEPFRNAIDAVGKALGEGLKWAVDLVVGALTWLWQNVLMPICDFLNDTVMPVINAVGGAFDWLGGIIGGALATIDYTIQQATGTWNATVLSKMVEMVKSVDDGMNAQLETVRAATQEQLALEQKSYDDQTKAALDFWNAFVEPPKTAWDEVVDAVSSKTDKQLEEITKWSEKEQGIIDKHCEDQIAAVKDSYSKQIADANAYYDDLIAITQNKLNEITIGRQKDLDNLELEMLRRKKAINDEAATVGMTADQIVAFNENKTARLNELEDQYRSVREQMTEGYRLKELEAEVVNTANIETVNVERNAVVSGLVTEQNEAVDKLNKERKEQTVFLEQLTNRQLEYLNNERNDTITRIRSEQQNIEETHQENIKQITQAGEAEQNRIIREAQTVKEQIVAESLSRITGMYAAQYTQAAQVAIGIGAGRFSSPQQIADALMEQSGRNYQSAVQTAAVLGQAEGWSQDQVNALIALIPRMATGGTASQDMLALVGEAGPEILKLNRGDSIIPLTNSGAGLGSVIQNFSISINIEGSVDERTLAVLRQELKSVIVEATSATGPTDLKRIRKGGVF